MLQEQGVPNQIGLGRLGHTPKFLVRHFEVAKRLGHEVVVNQQFVDSPKQQLLESGIIQVRMDIEDRRRSYQVLDLPCQGQNPRWSDFHGVRDRGYLMPRKTRRARRTQTLSRARWNA